MSTGSTLFWTVAAVIGVAMSAPSVTPIGSPEPGPTVRPPAIEPDVPQAEADLGNGLASQELTRSPDGHFYAEAQVNGARIRFLVDTGASVVALTPEDAQRAGIALGSERATAEGAGGDVEIIPVTIDRVAIGPLAANGVRGAVAEDLPVSLLGQSFLSRAASVEIRGDRMVMR